MSSSLPPRGTPRLIALDWGTSALRGYLLGDWGEVLERREEPWGLLQLPEGVFIAAYRGVTDEWLRRNPDLPAIACGMVGSARGWIEVPYVHAPAGIEEIARGVVSVPEAGLAIVPGIAQLGGSPNVMRGEETQIVGAIASHPAMPDHVLLVLPGTHSKWVSVIGGRVDAFSTYMTGELYAVLRAHSILGRHAPTMRPDAAPVVDSAAFERGVLVARDARQGLAPLLFSTRSAVLLGDLPAGDALEYLSGLLIGDEVRAGLADGRRPDALVGDATLCARYAVALALFGMSDVPTLDDTAPAGLWVIAQHASIGIQRGDGPSRSPISGRAN